MNPTNTVWPANVQALVERVSAHIIPPRVTVEPGPQPDLYRVSITGFPGGYVNAISVEGITGIVRLGCYWDLDKTELQLVVILEAEKGVAP